MLNLKTLKKQLRNNISIINQIEQIRRDISLQQMLNVDETPYLHKLTAMEEKLYKQLKFDLSNLAWEVLNDEAE